MKKVVFLGAKTIGLECLKILFESKQRLNIDLIGVLTNNRDEAVKNYCIDNNIHLIHTLDSFLEVKDVDIAISVQYHLILNKRHINKAKEIFVNLHMAPLPEYRGCNQFSFAIIDEKKEFGTTLHRLEEGIDSGDIIFEKRFPIPDGCWVEDLYQITFDKTVELFEESLFPLINGDFDLTPQKNHMDGRSCSLHYRKEIDEIKAIDLSWEQEKN